MQLELQWREAAPGVWRTSIGDASTLSPLLAVGAEPARAALEQMGSPDLPIDRDAIAATTVGSRTVLCLPLAEKEALYGLGLQFLKLNQRGRTRYLRVNSDPVQDTGETHAPVPFYVSSAGYGVLVDTAQIVTIHCDSVGRTQGPPCVEIAFAGGGATLHLFGGPTTLDSVRRYNLYCGGGVLPPLWGLGFWHRVHYQSTDAQTLAEAEEYRLRDYPCDVFGLEPGWQTRFYPCSYEWDPERYPKPSEFLARMKALGFRVNLWEHAYVSPDAALHPVLEPLSGSHTVWGGLVPDYTLPEARETLGAQHEREHLDRGVSGYKIDECDGSELTIGSWMFPAHAAFPSGNDGERMRQVFGLLLQKMTTDLFRKRNQRTYGLVRASNAGASPLPYVLYSDLYDDRQYVRALCNSGFSGLLWTPEVRSASTAEEWVRRIQVVCFSPLAQLDAWSSSTKPWSFPEVEPIVRHFLKLRVRLLPYLYSAFARYHFDGTPPFRAMAIESTRTVGSGDQVRGNLGVGAGLTSEAPDAGDVDDQWMVGDSLLVAPVFAGQTERDVLLPLGDWFDFETGDRFAGGRSVTVRPTLESIPVFVRDGGIVPLMPPLSRAPEAGNLVPLEVRHYGCAPGRFRLYDDDGVTFDYEEGKFRWLTLEAYQGTDGRMHGRTIEETGIPAVHFGPVEWRFPGNP